MTLAPTLLDESLDRLAAFEPTTFPVISLYLNTQADQHGKDNFSTFIKKEFTARAKTYPLRSPERNSFDRDVDRIQRYLRDELKPEANGLAVFACAGADDFFEAVQLEAPIENHSLYIFRQPHLYPMARLNYQYRRYAALIADANSARLFVFGLGKQLDEKRLNHIKINHTAVGGWSQARYQRHVENYHLHHAKEIVDALERTVRKDNIEQIVLAGDEVILPKLRAAFPPKLAELVIEVPALDMKSPEHKVFEATLEAIHAQDARNDAERVERLFDAYRAGGLAVVGVRETLEALANGQVDELLISSAPEKVGAAVAEDKEGSRAVPEQKEQAAEKLVTQALQTRARVSFIKDPALLADVGGVGATLRYRMD